MDRGVGDSGSDRCHDGFERGSKDSSGSVYDGGLTRRVSGGWLSGTGRGAPPSRRTIQPRVLSLPR